MQHRGRRRRRTRPGGHEQGRRRVKTMVAGEGASIGASGEVKESNAQQGDRMRCDEVQGDKPSSRERCRQHLLHRALRTRLRAIAFVPLVQVLLCDARARQRESASPEHVVKGTAPPTLMLGNETRYRRRLRGSQKARLVKVGRHTHTHTWCSFQCQQTFFRPTVRMSARKLKLASAFATSGCRCSERNVHRAQSL